MHIYSKSTKYIEVASRGFSAFNEPCAPRALRHIAKRLGSSGGASPARSVQSLRKYASKALPCACAQFQILSK